jgi:hypothetical protein
MDTFIVLTLVVSGALIDAARGGGDVWALAIYAGLAVAYMIWATMNLVFGERILFVVEPGRSSRAARSDDFVRNRPHLEPVEDQA